MTLDASTLPLAPFQAWVDERIQRAALEAGGAAAATGVAAVRRVAHELFPGRSTAAAERQLQRVRSGSRSSSRNGVKGQVAVDTWPAAEVDAALTNAGAHLADVYPDLYEPELELEPDCFCDRCHDVVTPIDGRCPWCEGSIDADDLRAKRFCIRCDELVLPAANGSCWRCEGPLSGVPHAPCACGCEAKVRLFDVKGRPVRYRRGHAPKEPDRGDLDAEAFAFHLRRCVDELDPIAAVARTHGLRRSLVADLLAGRVDRIERASVRRGLWMARRQGIGLPGAADVPTFTQLYPDAVRSRTCPDCGNGKAPHATRCRSCARAAGAYSGMPQSGGAGSKALGEAVIVDAWDLYLHHASTRVAAEAVLGRTRRRSVQALERALRGAWRERGWLTRGGAITAVGHAAARERRQVAA